MNRDAESVPGLQQIAAALEYIEERLSRSPESDERAGAPIRIEDVALVARYSPYHFLRVFHALTGETPGDYIRRRRLTCAARELTGGKRRIIDIALDWGFDSQAAFSRAFKRQFHAPPAAYRRAGRDRLDRERAAWTPEAFAHIGRGGISRPPRLESQDALTLVGFEAATNFWNDLDAGTGANRVIYDLWERYMAYNRKRTAREEAVAAATIAPEDCGQNVFYELTRLESAGAADSGITPDARFVKLVGQAVRPESPAAASPPDGMVSRRIPARRYAVFTHRGPLESIQASCDYIYGVWARETDLRLAAGDELQVFDSRRFRGEGPEPGSFEIRVPIQPA